MSERTLPHLPVAVVVKAGSPRLASSPEMSYLLSLTHLQAKRAFGGARLEIREDTDDLQEVEAGDRPVLLLGSEDVFVGEASLRAMTRELEQGADVVIPTAITSHPEVPETALFTLRDFELFEEHCLLGGKNDGALDAHDLPVSLWTAGAWRNKATLRDENRKVSRCGVFHAFVDYYGELRSDIEPYLPPHARDVLEVGCAAGRTGTWIQERLSCRVTGVEMHPGAAARASEVLHEVRVGDVASIEVGGPYDLVVAVELFEHLPEPAAVLAKLRDALRPGGRILLSVPNVGHYSIVADLVAGRWDYVPIGLLCYTHYRFYTRQTLVDWLERWHFQHYELIPQKTPIPERHQGLLELPDADAESLATKGFYVVIDPA